MFSLNSVGKFSGWLHLEFSLLTFCSKSYAFHFGSKFQFSTVLV